MYLTTSWEVNHVKKSCRREHFNYPLILNPTTFWQEYISHFPNLSQANSMINKTYYINDSVKYELVREERL